MMDATIKKRRRRKIDPSDDREVQVNKILSARDNGATLMKAARLAGVHISTVCRWQNRDAYFRESLKEAERRARVRKSFSAPFGRPRVPWSKVCPKCAARVVVKTAHTLRFWHCSRWLFCGWASWRPRAPFDCPKCRGA